MFHYYQFTDPDLKTNEAYGTCRNINTNIQVNEAYGTHNTTIQDTNIPEYEDMTSIPLQSMASTLMILIHIFNNNYLWYIIIIHTIWHFQFSTGYLD